MTFFKLKTRLIKRIDALEGFIEKLRDEREALEDENFRLRKELKDVKHQKKIEEEDIKHMVRIKQEKLDIEHERRGVKQEGEKAKAIEAVKDTYRDKIEKGLEESRKEMRGMYSEILERLPNVNLELKGKR